MSSFFTPYLYFLFYGSPFFSHMFILSEFTYLVYAFFGGSFTFKLFKHINGLSEFIFFWGCSVYRLSQMGQCCPQIGKKWVRRKWKEAPQMAWRCESGNIRNMWHDFFAFKLASCLFLFEWLEMSIFLLESKLDLFNLKNISLLLRLLL